MLLNQKCSVERKENIKNAYGQITATWKSIYKGCSCNIQYIHMSSSNLLSDATGTHFSGKYIGFFGANTNIVAGDRVIWGKITLFTKAVNPVYDSDGYLEHHLEVLFGLEDN